MVMKPSASEAVDMRPVLEESKGMLFQYVCLQRATLQSYNQQLGPSDRRLPVVVVLHRAMMSG